MQSAKCRNCVAIILPSLIEGGVNVLALTEGVCSAFILLPQSASQTAPSKMGRNTLAKEFDKLKFAKEKGGEFLHLKIITRCSAQL